MPWKRMRNIVRCCATPVTIAVLGTVLHVGNAAAQTSAAQESLQSPRVQPSPGLSASEANAESYRLAEDQRRWAIAEQLRLNEALRTRYETRPWAYYTTDYYNADTYFLGAPSVVWREGPRTVWRRSVRRPVLAAVSPDVPPWPPLFGQPFLGYSSQPIGHEQVWTGANSYYYRPIYANGPLARPLWASFPPPSAPQSGEVATTGSATAREFADPSALRERELPVTAPAAIPSKAGRAPVSGEPAAEASPLLLDPLLSGGSNPIARGSSFQDRAQPRTETEPAAADDATDNAQDPLPITGPREM